jgi:hypothetical protein
VSYTETADDRSGGGLERFVDAVVKRVGSRKLVKRTYKLGSMPVAVKHFLEEPIPGERSAVSRTYFDSSIAAERALSNVASRKRAAWELRPISDNWRLR